ncbi:MAG: porin, partial [Flavobacteriales bacterium]
MKKLSVIVVLMISSMTFSQEEVSQKFGKGFINVLAQDSSWSMKLGVRIQSLYIGEWDVNETNGIGVGTSSFLIRRARLKFGGFVYSPKLQYKIELGLSNKDLGKVDSRNNFAPKMILDAVI